MSDSQQQGFFPGEEGWSEDWEREFQRSLDQGTVAGWNPAPGETLIGTVTDVDTADAGGYGEYPLLEIETTDGRSVAVHCFHLVLGNQIRRKNPQVGDRIGIKYYGRVVPESGGQEYESYRVKLRRADDSRK